MTQTNDMRKAHPTAALAAALLSAAAVELQEAHAEIARLRCELSERKAPEVSELNACETPEEAKELAHRARLAAAVGAHTWATWCERQEAEEGRGWAKVDAHRRAVAARRVADLAAMAHDRFETGGN